MGKKEKRNRISFYLIRSSQTSTLIRTFKEIPRRRQYFPLPVVKIFLIMLKASDKGSSARKNLYKSATRTLFTEIKPDRSQLRCIVREVT